jgi:hypothetical protein
MPYQLSPGRWTFSAGIRGNFCTVMDWTAAQTGTADDKDAISVCEKLSRHAWRPITRTANERSSTGAVEKRERKSQE